jgi:cytochrome P450
LIALSLAAANRDEHEFPSPDECIIEREPNRHLSFGHGVHKCVGAPLGRLEIRVALEEVLAATSSFELNGDAEPNTAIFLGGLSSLPLRFTPR